MGGVKDTLFGSPAKASSQSHSGNYAYDSINSAFSPALGYLTGGGNLIGNMLGVGGGPAQLDALNNYANSGGMQFLMQQGQNAVTSSKAAQGLLKSGSYGTALEKFGQGLASTYLNQYMNNLLDYSKLGLGAGSVLADAGRYSDSTSKSNGGKKGLLSSLATGAAQAAASGGGGGG